LIIGSRAAQSALVNPIESEVSLTLVIQTLPLSGRQGILCGAV
jgi:hypothetical protein